MVVKPDCLFVQVQCATADLLVKNLVVYTFNINQGRMGLNITVK